ncbi:hypothetical protein D0Z03_000044 [Geotrichum reessii]|nr:hypothetical protein D0Z03_000044 [Galactomyces reessii]
MMKHKTTHYYPNDNKQAMDLIGLAFFIALALVYTVVVGIKLIKMLPVFRSSNAKHQQDEGYRLADFDEEDDYESRAETLNKRMTDLHIRLVPGAHQGRGLGNKFLDDLRHADALIHVVDVSGTTDAEGKATRGYDPLNDIDWLQDEIFRWIEGNLKERWGSIKRRHTATKSSTIDTLQNQFSGYGSTAKTVARALASIKTKLPPLEEWTDDDIKTVVRAFTNEKFPTVLALNKMDHPDADKNVSKIIKKHPDSKAVLTSAITEVFIRKLSKQGYVIYEEGTEFLDTKDDLPESDLKELDDKLRS